MKRRKLEVGDRIKFRAVTRCSDRAVWRQVNGFYGDGLPTVRFEGWGNFVVHWREILEVERAAKGAPA